MPPRPTPSTSTSRRRDGCLRQDVTEAVAGHAGGRVVGCAGMSGRTRHFVRGYNSEALSRLGALIAGLDEEQLKKAARRAQVSTYRSGVAMVNADVRSRYGVKLSALRGAYRVVIGRDRKRQDYVAVEATGRRINLLEFSGRWSRPKGDNLKRQRSKGATAVVHAGKRKAYASAFIASIGWRSSPDRMWRQRPCRRRPRAFLALRSMRR